MKVSEKNFLASQAFYGLCVSNPGITTMKQARPLIKLATKIAVEMIKENKQHKTRPCR